jgi:hypothetical protein
LFISVAVITYNSVGGPRASVLHNATTSSLPVVESATRRKKKNKMVEKIKKRHKMFEKYIQDVEIYVYFYAIFEENSLKKIKRM